MDFLCPGKYFAKLDLASGYWINEPLRPKPLFRTAFQRFYLPDQLISFLTFQPLSPSDQLFSSSTSRISILALQVFNTQIISAFPLFRFSVSPVFSFSAFPFLNFSAVLLFRFSVFLLFCFSAFSLFRLSLLLLFSFSANSSGTQPLSLLAVSASQISYLSSCPCFTLLSKFNRVRKRT